MALGGDQAPGAVAPGAVSMCVVRSYFRVENERSAPAKYLFIASWTSLEARLTLSSQEYGMPTACSTIILFTSAYAWLRLGPAGASAAFVSPSVICWSSSMLQFTLPTGLMALPLNVGSRSDWGSEKSLNQPTFGQIT